MSATERWSQQSNPLAQGLGLMMGFVFDFLVGFASGRVRYDAGNQPITAPQD
jgi:hypothetical protein